MPGYLHDLNTDQRKAVEQLEGINRRSGKTRVLTYKLTSPKME